MHRWILWLLICLELLSHTFVLPLLCLVPSNPLLSCADSWCWSHTCPSLALMHVLVFVHITFTCTACSHTCSTCFPFSCSFLCYRFEKKITIIFVKNALSAITSYKCSDIYSPISFMLEFWHWHWPYPRHLLHFSLLSTLLHMSYIYITMTLTCICLILEDLFSLNKYVQMWYKPQVFSSNDLCHQL